MHTGCVHTFGQRQKCRPLFLRSIKMLFIFGFVLRPLEFDLFPLTSLTCNVAGMRAWNAIMLKPILATRLTIPETELWKVRLWSVEVTQSGVFAASTIELSAYLCGLDAQVMLPCRTATSIRETFTFGKMRSKEFLTSSLILHFMFL